MQIVQTEWIKDDTVDWDTSEIHTLHKITAGAVHYLRPKALEGGLRNLQSQSRAAES